MNGIRSASNKGAFTWLDSQGADFICVQEVKAHESDLSHDMKNYRDYTSYFSFAEKKAIAVWVFMPKENLIKLFAR
jgi:exodeoxyribonuclease-3